MKTITLWLSETTTVVESNECREADRRQGEYYYILPSITELRDSGALTIKFLISWEERKCFCTALDVEDLM